MKKTAWVAGASGLIGGHLVRLLSDNADYKKVIAFVRKPIQEQWAQHEKIEQWCVNYDKLVAKDATEKVDELYCALGSTTRKTPDKNNYYKIDVSYPLTFAELGQSHGAKYFGLVSSHGAKANSSFSFYLKMKGQLEQKLKHLNYQSTCVARPSLLKGDREEFRIAEKLSESFMSLLPGNYKAIESIDVAASLIDAARNNQPQGFSLLSSKIMQERSKSL